MARFTPPGRIAAVVKDGSRFSLDKHARAENYLHPQAECGLIINQPCLLLRLLLQYFSDWWYQNAERTLQKSVFLLSVMHIKPSVKDGRFPKSLTLISHIHPVNRIDKWKMFGKQRPSKKKKRWWLVLGLSVTVSVDRFESNRWRFPTGAGGATCHCPCLVSCNAPCFSKLLPKPFRSDTETYFHREKHPVPFLFLF